MTEEEIRAALADELWKQAESAHAIHQVTGLPLTQINRIIGRGTIATHGSRGITLGTAIKVADAVGLEVVVRRKRNR